LKNRFSKIFLLAFLVVATSTLNSCNSKSELKHGENLIAQDSSFDRKKFIEQSKLKSVQDYDLGPKVDNESRISKRESYRKLINKEDSFDYVDMDELASKNFKVSINVENMDIRSFANLLSEITGVNVLISDEVQGTISASLKDVYWTSMIESILKTKQLAKHIDGKSNIIRIHNQATVVQLEEFESKRKENVQRTLLLKKASQPLQTEIFKLFYTEPTVVKATIEDILQDKGLKNESIRNINPEITVDERKNLIVVKARETDMSIVAKLIQELDTRTKQVYIEAFIVEVNDDFERAFGSRFGFQTNRADGAISGLAGAPSSGLALGSGDGLLGNNPVTNPTGGVGFLTNFGGSASSLKVELTAMENQGLTKVISNPKIFTLDNQEAIIFQGDEVPYETVSDEGTKVEFKEAGLRLAVTPSIIGDGNLMLQVEVNKDSVDTSQDNPPITKSEIKTSLVTKNDEIVVIGGIYTESESKSKSKVPGAGDVPLFGKLFSRDEKGDDRKELIIFIAPKIL